MMTSYQVVYVGLELVIALLAMAGNVLVCWSVCLNSNLQSITNFFVVSLAVADIAVGLLAIPFAITISVGFCADFYGCLFIACFVLVLTQSSIFSLLAIAVDRYIAIKNPLRYSGLVTAQRAKGIIALCWALSVGIGLTPMFGWNTGQNSTFDPSERDDCPKGMTQCLFEEVVPLDYMVFFNFFGCVLIPLLVMLVIYANIFMAARHQLRTMSLKVSHTPGPRQRALSSSSSRSILQREVRAAKSLAIIVGLFAFCWLPLHIINCFNHLCENCERPHIWVINIAIILSHANSAVNPLIYAYRIREFRQTFRKIVYQNILRRRDGHGIGVGGADSRDAGSQSIRRTSHISKEGSSCGTVVNSYVLDLSLGHTRPEEMGERSCHWTSNAAPRSHVPNGHLVESDTLSAVQEPPCTLFSTENAVKSATYMGGAVDVVEMEDMGSCIDFVNVQALSLKQTDCSTNITEVS
ncbi:adenosine A2a receptor b [Cololabis saira]|uniref:adenosine A2a receptor b n=1 Tax=Cololabis saira TaxID=129043 RepID=UPI002AD2421F|nr:adenosine A2a receptor b [Cololabis saira]XP_061590298.1 adenosine A2a receptor b [Cololabis saira]